MTVTMPTPGQLRRAAAEPAVYRAAQASEQPGDWTGM